MLLFFLVVIGLAALAYVFRKQIQIAIQERRLSNAVKTAEDAIAGHEPQVVAEAQKIIADAKATIERLKNELGKK